MSSYLAIEAFALSLALTDKRNALAHARSAMKVAIVLKRPDLAWRCNEMIAAIGAV